VSKDLIAVLVIIAVPLFWVVITTLIARVGGWSLLGREYTLQDAMPDERWRFQSAFMRYNTAYRNGLTFAADYRGLYVAPFVIFRAGHPPLFIPWGEISVAGREENFGPWIELRFARVPSVPFKIPEALAEKLRERAGSAWPRKS
jgi:hypothetical protein